MNAKITQEVASSPDPFVAKTVPPLDAIPVVAATVAQVIVAEIGVEMKQFPTAKHLSSSQKIDPRLSHQWERLVEIREIQLELISEVRDRR